MATGTKRNQGAELYRKAKTLMPGGTQLFGKRSEMHLPDHWPAYYSRAKGCEIWDLDGRRLIDMHSSGIGTCVLGYADDDVCAAVKAAVDAGTMTTLSPPVEVELAELLIDLHPWSQMVRYTRTGGESMAAAIRIARAYTGRDKVAFCGYHGWTDWYVSANLGDSRALEGHLLPGIPPAGVPQGLRGTILPFQYNQIGQLEEIVAKHGQDLGVIVLESVRHDEPKDGFLDKVRQVADDVSAVMILDEITAGWRHEIGGAHLRYNVEPDIAVFAKAISNGHPMGAVLGRAKVMEAAKDVFLSSSYWTESLGPTAALATIQKIQRIKLPEKLAHAGQKIKEGWRRLADKYGLKITISGLPALCNFSLDYGEQADALRTLLTQEMLDRNYLAACGFYANLTHTDQVIRDYLTTLDEVFSILAAAIDQDNVISRLRGPVAKSTFHRLT